MKKIVVFLTFLMASLPAFSATTVVFLDSGNQEIGRDGTSWATAYNSLSEAATFFESLGSDTDDIELWLKSGTYEVSDRVEFDRAAPKPVLMPISLYGGFSGIESDRNSLVLNSNSTLIQGLNTEAEIYSFCGFSVYGLTLSDFSGGPALTSDSLVSSKSCTFSGNYCAIRGVVSLPAMQIDTVFDGNGINTKTPREGQIPGAVWAESTDPAYFYNCTFFRNNRIGNDGPIFFQSASTGSKIVAVNCIFWSNDYLDDTPITVSESSDVLDDWKNSVVTSDMSYYTTGANSATMLSYEHSFTESNPFELFEDGSDKFALRANVTSGSVNPCRNSGCVHDYVSSHDVYGKTRTIGISIDRGASEFWRSGVDFEATPRRGMSAPRENVDSSGVSVEDDTVTLTEGWWEEGQEVFLTPTQGSTLPNPLHESVRYILYESEESFTFHLAEEEVTPIDITDVGTGSFYVRNSSSMQDSFPYNESFFNSQDNRITLLSSYWRDKSEINLFPSSSIPSGISSENVYYLGNGRDEIYFWRLRNKVTGEYAPIPVKYIQDIGEGSITIAVMAGVSETFSFNDPDGKQIYRGSAGGEGEITLLSSFSDGDEVSITGDIEDFFGSDYAQEHGSDAHILERRGSAFSSFTLHTAPGDGVVVDMTSDPTGVFYVTRKDIPVNLFSQFRDLTYVDGEVLSRSWDIYNDGTVDSTEEMFNYLFDREGSFDVKLTVSVRDINGNLFEDSLIKADYVSVANAGTELSVDFSSDSRTGFSPCSIQFSSYVQSSEAEEDLNYAWDFGDGSSSTDKNPSHIYLSPGTYDVVLSVSYLGKTEVIKKSSYVKVPEKYNTRVYADYRVRVYPDFGITLSDGSFILNKSTDSPDVITGWSWEVLDESSTVVATSEDRSFVFEPDPELVGPGKYTVSVSLFENGETEECASAEYVDFFEVLEPVKIGASFSTNFLRPGQEVFIQNDSVLRTTTDRFDPETVVFTVTGPNGFEQVEEVAWDERMSPGIELTDIGSYSVEVAITGEVVGSYDKEFSQTFTDVITVGEGFNSSLNFSPSVGVIPLKVTFKDNSFRGDTNPPSSWVWNYGDGGGNVWKDLNSNSPSEDPTLSIVPTYSNHRPENDWGLLSVDDTYVDMGNRTGSFSFEGSYADNGVRSPSSFGESAENELPPLSSLSYDPNNHVYSPSYTYKYPGEYEVSLVSDGNEIESSRHVEALPPVEVEFGAIGRSSYDPVVVQFVPNLVKYVDAPVSFLWEFEGGTPSTSTSSHPVVTYSSAIEGGSGDWFLTYDVKLTVSVGGWSSSRIKKDFVEVCPPVVGSFSYQVLGSEVIEGEELYTARVSTDIFFCRTNDSIKSIRYVIDDTTETTEESLIDQYSEGFYAPEIKVELNSEIGRFIPIGTDYDGAGGDSTSGTMRVGNPIRNEVSVTPQRGYAPLTVSAVGRIGGKGFSTAYWVSQETGEEPRFESSYQVDSGDITDFLRKSFVFEEPGIYFIGLATGSVENEKLMYYTFSPKVIEVLDGESPSADFSSENSYRDKDMPSKGIIPLQVKFFDRSDFGKMSETRRLWDFGDGETSSEKNPVHTYFTEGIYTVSLTVYTDGGKSDVIRKEGFVRAHSLPIADFGYEAVPNNFVGSERVFLVDRMNGSSVEDGKTWATAYRNVQDAVDAANEIGGGDVWVCGGYYGKFTDLLGIFHRDFGYSPPTGWELQNKTTFGDCTTEHYGFVILPGGVNLYGGFDRDDFTFEERDYVKNLTVVDGFYWDSLDSVIIAKGDSIIEGLTVIGGSASPTFASDRDGDCDLYTGKGGGILAVDSRIDVTNCRFLFNSAYQGAAVAGTNSTVRIENCEFEENVGVQGSVYISEKEGDSYLNMFGSLVKNNTSTASIKYFSGEEGSGFEYNPAFLALKVVPRVGHEVLRENAYGTNENSCGSFIVYMAGNGSSDSLSVIIQYADFTRISGSSFTDLSGNETDVTPIGYSISDGFGRVEYIHPEFITNEIGFFNLSYGAKELLQYSPESLSFNVYCKIGGVESDLEGPPDFQAPISLYNSGLFLGIEKMECPAPVRLDSTASSVYMVTGDSYDDDYFVDEYIYVRGDFENVLNGKHVEPVAYLYDPFQTRNIATDLEVTVVSVSKDTMILEIPDEIDNYDFSTMAPGRVNKLLTKNLYVGTTYEGGSALSNSVSVSFSNEEVNSFARQSLGAVVFSGKRASIQDCTFVENDSMYSAGAMYLDGTAKVSGCLFQGNTSSTGGALSLYVPEGGVSGERTNRFDRCTFLENTACAGPGGAVSLVFGNYGDSFLEVLRVGEFQYPTSSLGNISTEFLTCLFSENGSAVYGNAASFLLSTRIINCSFLENVLEEVGYSGFKNSTLENLSDARVTVQNCVIWSDQDIVGIGGDDAPITIENSVIKGGVDNLTNDISVNVSEVDPLLLEGYPPYRFGLLDGDGKQVVMYESGHDLSEDVDLSKATVNEEEDVIKLTRPEWEIGNLVSAYLTEEYGDPLALNGSSKYSFFIAGKSDSGVSVSQDGTYRLPEGINPVDSYVLSNGVPASYRLKNEAGVVEIGDVGDLRRTSILFYNKQDDVDGDEDTISVVSDYPPQRGDKVIWRVSVFSGEPSFVLQPGVVYEVGDVFGTAPNYSFNVYSGGVKVDLSSADDNPEAIYVCPLSGMNVADRRYFATFDTSNVLVNLDAVWFGASENELTGASAISPGDLVVFSNTPGDSPGVGFLPNVPYLTLNTKQGFTPSSDVDPVTDTLEFSWDSDAWPVGSKVRVSGAEDAGIDEETDYYVLSNTSGAVTLSETLGGVILDLSASSSDEAYLFGYDLLHLAPVFSGVSTSTVSIEDSFSVPFESDVFASGYILFGDDVESLSPNNADVITSYDVYSDTDSFLYEKSVPEGNNEVFVFSIFGRLPEGIGSPIETPYGDFNGGYYDLELTTFGKSVYEISESDGSTPVDIEGEGRGVFDIGTVSESIVLSGNVDIDSDSVRIDESDYGFSSFGFPVRFMFYGAEGSALPDGLRENTEYQSTQKILIDNGDPFYKLRNFTDSTVADIESNGYGYMYVGVMSNLYQPPTRISVVDEDQSMFLEENYVVIEADSLLQDETLMFKFSDGIEGIQSGVPYKADTVVKNACSNKYSMRADTGEVLNFSNLGTSVTVSDLSGDIAIDADNDRVVLGTIPSASLRVGTRVRLYGPGLIGSGIEEDSDYYVESYISPGTITLSGSPGGSLLSLSAGAADDMSLTTFPGAFCATLVAPGVPVEVAFIDETEDRIPLPVIEGVTYEDGMLVSLVESFSVHDPKITIDGLYPGMNEGSVSIRTYQLSSISTDYVSTGDNPEYAVYGYAKLDELGGTEAADIETSHIGDETYMFFVSDGYVEFPQIIERNSKRFYSDTLFPSSPRLFKTLAGVLPSVFDSVAPVESHYFTLFGPTSSRRSFSVVLRTMEDEPVEISYSGQSTGYQGIYRCAELTDLSSRIDVSQDVIVLSDAIDYSVNNEVVFSLDNGRYPSGIVGGMRYFLTPDWSYPVYSGNRAYRICLGDFTGPIQREDNLLDIRSSGVGTMLVYSITHRDENVLQDVVVGTSTTGFENSVRLRMDRDMRYLPEDASFSEGQEVLFYLPNMLSHEEYTAPTGIETGTVYSLSEEIGEDRFHLLEGGSEVSITSVGSGKGYDGDSKFISGEMYCFSGSFEVVLDADNVSVSEDYILLSGMEDVVPSEGAVVIFSGDSLPTPLVENTPYLIKHKSEDIDGKFSVESLVANQLRNASMGGMIESVPVEIESVGTGVANVLFLYDVVSLGAGLDQTGDLVSVSCSGLSGNSVRFFPRAVTEDLKIDGDFNGFGDGEFSVGDTARFGRTGLSYSPVQLGASGDFGGGSLSIVSLYDDKWSIGNEVVFRPEGSSLLPAALQEDTVYWIFGKDEITEAPKTRYFVSRDRSSMAPIDVSDTGAGFMSMILVSPGTEVISFDRDSIDSTLSRVRLENEIWNPFDRFITSSSFLTRYPTPLFEGQEYQIDGMEYFPSSRMAPLYDYVFPDFPDFNPIEFIGTRNVYRKLRGEAYLTQSGSTNVSVSSEDVADGKQAVVESIRSDKTNLSSIRDGKINLTRQNWEDGTEVVFSSEADYEWDANAILGDPIVGDEEIGMVHEFLFEDVCKKVAFSLTENDEEPCVLLQGDRLLQRYDIVGTEWVRKDAVVCSSQINDAVMAPFRKRYFVACKDRVYPYREYSANTGELIGGHDCAGMIVDGLISIRRLRTPREAIVLSDNYKKGGESVFSISTHTDEVGGLPGTDSNPELEVLSTFVPEESEFSGSIPLSIEVVLTGITGSSQTGQTCHYIVFVLYSNNKIARFSYVFEIGTDGGTHSQESAYVGYKDVGEGRNASSIRAGEYADNAGNLAVLCSSGIEIVPYTNAGFGESSYLETPKPHNAYIGEIEGNEELLVTTKRGILRSTDTDSASIDFYLMPRRDGHLMSLDSDGDLLATSFSAYESSTFGKPSKSWVQIYDMSTWDEAKTVWDLSISEYSDDVLDLEYAGGKFYGKQGHHTPPLGVVPGSRYVLNGKESSWSPYDPRVLTGSPLIDSGKTNGLPLDISGTRRPQGNGTDIGVSEYFGEVSPNTGRLFGKSFILNDTGDISEVSLSSGTVIRSVGRLDKDIVPSGLIFDTGGYLYVFSGNGIYRVNTDDGRLFLSGTVPSNTVGDVIGVSAHPVKGMIALIQGVDSVVRMYLLGGNGSVSLHSVVANETGRTITGSEITGGSFRIFDTGLIENLSENEGEFYSFVLTTQDRIWTGVIGNNFSTLKSASVLRKGTGPILGFSEDDYGNISCVDKSDNSMNEVLFSPNGNVEIRKVFEFAASIGSVSFSTSPNVFGYSGVGKYSFPVKFFDKSRTGMDSLRSWLWNFGDGSLSSEREPVHSYSWPGDYSVTFGVSNGAGRDVTERDISIGGEVFFERGDYNLVTITRMGRANSRMPYLPGYGNLVVLLPANTDSKVVRLNDDAYLIKGTATVSVRESYSWRTDYLVVAGTEVTEFPYQISATTDEQEIVGYFTGSSNQNPFRVSRSHSNTYSCGGDVLMNITLRFSSKSPYVITQLEMSEDIGQNMSFDSVVSAVGSTFSTLPVLGSKGVITFPWSQIPEGESFQIVYAVRVDAEASGNQDIRGSASYRLDGEEKPIYGPVVSRVTDDCSLSDRESYALEISVTPSKDNAGAVCGGFLLQSQGDISLTPEFVAPNGEDGVTIYKGVGREIFITAREPNPCYAFSHYELSDGTILVDTDGDITYELTSDTTIFAVFEDEAPTVSINATVEVELEADIEKEIDIESVDNGSTDNCEIVRRWTEPSVVTCEDVPSVSATFYAEDANGNLSYDTFVVNVTDSVDPSLETVAEYEMELDTETATLLPSVLITSVSDNCHDLEVSIKRSGEAEFSASLTIGCDDLGDSTVTVRAEDAYGNYTDSDVDLTVAEGDYTCFEATCKTATTVVLDTDPKTVTFEMVDDGSVGYDSYELSPTTFTAADLGTTVPVTLTLTRGVSEKSCVCNVSVVSTSSGSPVVITRTVTVPVGGTFTTEDADGGTYVPNGSPFTLLMYTDLSTPPRVGVQSTTVSSLCSVIGLHIGRLEATSGAYDDDARFGVCVTPGTCTTDASDATVTLDGDGQGTLSVEDVSPSVSGTCSESVTWAYTLSQESFTCFDVGEKEITVTGYTELIGGMPFYAAPKTITVTVEEGVEPSVCDKRYLWVTIGDNTTNNNVVEDLGTRASFTLIDTSNGDEIYMVFGFVPSSPPGNTVNSGIIDLPYTINDPDSMYVHLASDVPYDGSTEGVFWIPPAPTHLEWMPFGTGKQIAVVTANYIDPSIYSWSMLQLNFQVDHGGFNIPVNSPGFASEPWTEGHEFYWDVARYFGIPYSGETWRATGYKITRMATETTQDWKQASNAPSLVDQQTNSVSLTHPEGYRNGTILRPGTYMVRLAVPSANWNVTVTSSTPGALIYYDTHTNQNYRILINVLEPGGAVINVAMSRKWAYFCPWVYVGETGMSQYYYGAPCNDYYNPIALHTGLRDFSGSGLDKVAVINQYNAVPAGYIYTNVASRTKMGCGADYVQYMCGNTPDENCYWYWVDIFYGHLWSIGSYCQYFSVCHETPAPAGGYNASISAWDIELVRFPGSSCTDLPSNVGGCWTACATQQFIDAHPNIKRENGDGGILGDPCQVGDVLLRVGCGPPECWKPASKKFHASCDAAYIGSLLETISCSRPWPE